MNSKTFRKDYFISILNDKVIISKNPNNTENVTFEDICDVTKRYLYEVGDKILTPFGIQTIKEIVKDYGDVYGYEWLIMVEENKNQYKPCELIGIVVKELSLIEFNNYIKLNY